MHDSMTKKLDMLIDRQAEIQNLLIQPETSNDINLLTELNKEFADINPIAELYSEYKDLMQVIEEAKQIIEMGDEDLMALAEEDLKNNQDRPAALEKQLKIIEANKIEITLTSKISILKLFNFLRYQETNYT